MMKNLLHKTLKKNQTPPPDTGGRITNETVAEHRERVLAGGRKFKYPLQYTKHRVLIISIIIVTLTTISFFGFGAWQLYGAQSTDKFMYSLTQFIPVPVAKVDGDWVRYSDYLMELRSSIHYLSTKEAVNFTSDDGRRQLDYQKRLALDKAVQNTYVARLAGQNNITVSDKEVDEFVKQQISSNRLGVNETVYRQVIRDYYDWSFDEYKSSIHNQLLRKKVMAKLDVDGRKRMEEVLQAVTSGGQDFAALAKAQSEDVISKAQGGDVGIVNIGTDDPNGIIKVAAGLQVGQVSQIIDGVDGFYLVKLMAKPDADNIQFSKIYISYKVLNQKLAELKKDGKLEELITVKQIATPTN
ncbi:MAG TPA: peptidylprolyl isomerase [Candidatus Saccharimonadales bacterium]|nr:peptidylprolyl isomerase [Candidatus Saccharimonadales bacterium]